MGGDDASHVTFLLPSHTPRALAGLQANSAASLGKYLGPHPCADDGLGVDTLREAFRGYRG